MNAFKAPVVLWALLLALSLGLAWAGDSAAQPGSGDLVLERYGKGLRATDIKAQYDLKFVYRIPEPIGVAGDECTLRDGEWTSGWPSDHRKAL